MRTFITYKIFLLTLLLVFCKNLSAQKNTDTVFVAKTNINKAENTFYYSLIFVNKNTQHIIYKEHNRDYSVEMDTLPYTLITPKATLQEFVIYDLPTGRNKSIIRNKNTSTFYVTNWYNNNSGSDTLMLSTINLSADSVLVSSSTPPLPNYKVKFSKIWQPAPKP